MGVLLVSGATVLAGSYTNDFSNPDNTLGITLNGSGTLEDGSPWMPVIANNALLLATNAGSLLGSMVLDDLDAGAAIEGFTARFKLLLEGSAMGSRSASDPMSIRDHFLARAGRAWPAAAFACRSISITTGSLISLASV